MRILVFGGAGYIGSHTALELIRAGEEVVVADNLQTGFRAAIPEGATFYQGDIRDRAFLDDLFTKEKIDAGKYSDSGNRPHLSDQPIWRNQAGNGKDVLLDCKGTWSAVCFPPVFQRLRCR